MEEDKLTKFLKKTLHFLLFVTVLGLLIRFNIDKWSKSILGPLIMSKPVVYLYPEEKIDVDVELLCKNGYLSFTYPKYEDKWQVTAYPDGRIIAPDGKEYSYLFWEANAVIEYDFNQAFVVKGSEIVPFLQEKLAFMGLTPREYNEFIVYWAPKMENNKYNLIAFQNEVYTDSFPLNIKPQPDSVLRVFMAYKAIDEAIDVEPQTLTAFKREGFSVIEWGGSEVK